MEEVTKFDSNRKKTPVLFHSLFVSCPLPHIFDTISFFLLFPDSNQRCVVSRLLLLAALARCRGTVALPCFMITHAKYVTGRYTCTFKDGHNLRQPLPAVQNNATGLADAM